MRARILPALLSLAACAARAGDVQVVSQAPDSVSVTIYRDLFALVTEQRTVHVPPGPVTLRIENVVETLLPQSVAVSFPGRKTIERNYDYDELSPYSLYTRSIGKTVTLMRGVPRSDRVLQQRVTIVAAGRNGVTFRTEDGLEALHCTGLPDDVVFDAIPDGLHAKPTLSLNLTAGEAGSFTFSVSYLAHGFTWRSDYVARFGERAGRMDLTGWATLRNLTNASFRAAQVQVVAGRLNLLDVADGGSSLFGDTADFSGYARLQEARDEQLEELEAELEEDPEDDPPQEMDVLTRCYPWGPERSPPDIGRFPDSHLAEALRRVDGIESEDIQEVIVTGLRRSGLVERQSLGDYQLYRLPWPTDLNARQSKQAVFLRAPAIEVDRFYSYRLRADFSSSRELEPPVARVAFENRKSAGLGSPLPEGEIRFFESTDDGDVFVGETKMLDEAVGSPVELAFATAMDLALTVDYTDLSDRYPRHYSAGDVRIAIMNDKPVTVPLEIRLIQDPLSPNARVENATRRPGRKFGDPAWRLDVPAYATGALAFRLRVPEEPRRRGE